jgi:hypothetical protein
MSCDHSSYCTSVIDCVPCSSLTVEVDDYASSETDLDVEKSLKQSWRGPTADQSKSKGYRHEVRSRIIQDCTETDPEYVWGDEGPIND